MSEQAWFVAARDRICEIVAAQSNELVRLAADLIAMPTPNPPGDGYRRCVQLLAAELRRSGLAPTFIRVPGADDRPRYCLVAVLGEGEPTLHFHGHYDVVPAADPDDFMPRLAEGRLYGRGSSDMKGGLASLFGALRALSKLGLPRRGRIVVSLVPDEETGGELGTAYLWRAGHLAPGAIGMLMPEATSGAIWHANRGALSLRVTVHGRPAHVGLAHQGASAFAGLVSIASELLALGEVVAQRQTLEAVDPAEGDRSVMLVGGQCGGGTNFNVVPQECWFTVDRRLNPEETLAMARAEVVAAIEKATPAGLHVAWEVFQEGEAAKCPPDTPLAGALARAVAAVTGATPPFVMCPGLCEIRFFIHHGVPALAYGPGLLHVSHGPREYVEVDKIVQCAAIYALTAATLLDGQAAD